MTNACRRSLFIAVAATFLSVLSNGICLAQTKKLSDRETAYFEANIRPLLVKHCYDCHSVESGAAEGGLRVDSGAALLRGGKTGPAIVPGNPTAACLS